MSLRYCLTSIVLVCVAMLMIGPAAVAGESEPDGSKDRTSTQQTKPAATQPEEDGPPLGVVQKALIELYHFPRASAHGASSPNNTSTGDKKPVQTSQDKQHRLGLQHQDAIRHSVSSVPIGDDIRGAIPPGNDPNPARNKATDEAAALESASVHINPYYYYNYRQGPRLSHKKRQWSEYRYYNGQPGRYGYGRYSRGLGGVPEDGAGGEYFRFGFNQGYDRGRFEAEANERTQRLLGRANTHLSRGLQLFQEGYYREAAAAFKLAAETNQGDPASRIYATHALFAIGRYKDAVKFLRRALELEPDIAYLAYDLRNDYGKRADFDEHLVGLDQALRAFPRNLDRLILMGYVLCYSHQLDAAYPVLMKARKVAGKDALVARLLDKCQPPDVALDQMKTREKP